jgi:tight adherence protein C
MNAAIEWLLLGLVFASAVLLVVGVSRWLAPARVDERLRDLRGDAPHDAWGSLAEDGMRALTDLVTPLSRLAAPDEGFEQSSLKLRFAHAGIRDRRAPMVFFGLKALMFLVLPVLGAVALQAGGSTLAGQQLLLVLLLVGVLGYCLPNVVLKRMIQARQRDLFEAFPDALDLLTICVEAGLGPESAMMRVADDIALKSPVLAEELQLVNIELRAGMERERALRNLAFRTGVPEIDGFVTMVIQAERFGTSIGAALRVHSDMLRSRRRQRAEEAAAKIGIKLMFPLMFCIFPALFIVLLLPAGINLMKAVSALSG